MIWIPRLVTGGEFVFYNKIGRIYLVKIHKNPDTFLASAQNTGDCNTNVVVI